jgi:hypothetical protein
MIGPKSDADKKDQEYRLSSIDSNDGQLSDSDIDEKNIT